MISDFLGFLSSGSAGINTGSAVVDAGTDFFATVIATIERMVGGFGS